MRNKIVVIFTLIVLIIIESCLLGLTLLNKEENELAVANTKASISVSAQSGIPALSLIGPLTSPEYNLETDIVHDEQELVTAFDNNVSDLIIAPINLGLEQVKNGANYKMLGIVSWGNAEIVGSAERYDEIAIYDEQGVIGTMLDKFHSEIGTKIVYNSFESQSEVADALLSDTYSTGVLTEPMLIKVKSSYISSHEDEELKVKFSLSELFEEETGYENYPVYAFFVNNDLVENDYITIVNFISNLSISIETFNQDSSKLANLPIDIEQLGFNSLDFLIEAYPNFSLNYLYVTECKDAVNAYLKMFGMSLNDDNYVK